MPDEPFLPYATERTVLRPLGPADTRAFAAYRSDPEVARYQDWALPYAGDRAAELIAAQAGLSGPTAGRWIQIGIEHEGELVGDLAVGLDESGALAMLGYTLRGDRQGRGLAFEAAASLVDRLFAVSGVHRVSATLDPANLASARLLERLGFRYEGLAVGVALVRGEWLDDDRYALLASDRQAWLARSTEPPADVRLVDVGPRNLRSLTSLAVHHSQERFAPSVRDALLEVLVEASASEPHLRAYGVEADGEVVGLVVITDRSEGTAATLRTLIIDRRHQRRGIGSAVVQLLAEHAARRHAITTRWPAGPFGPQRFFQAVGFEITELGDATVASRLELS